MLLRNPKVAGSNPVPDTIIIEADAIMEAVSLR